MNLNVDAQTIGIAAGGFTLAGLVWHNFRRLSRFVDEHDELVKKVNTMWSFFYSRGISEALEKGMVKMNSPIKFATEEIERDVRQAYASLMAQITKVAHASKQVSDLEMSYRLESVIGPAMAFDVCPKLKIHKGACLAFAVMLANESIGRETEVKPGCGCQIDQTPKP